MESQIEIITPRLLLKSITPAIIHSLFEEKTKEEIIAFFETDEIGYNDLKNKHEKGMETHRISMFYFLLFDKETHKIIGECGFHSWNKTHNRAELFYSLRNEIHKRKGLMTEAVIKVLDFGFNELELHRIEALVANWNIASVKLLEHFEFIKEGTMREDYIVDGKYENSECYSLLKWEWEKNNNNQN